MLKYFIYFLLLAATFYGFWIFSKTSSADNKNTLIVGLQNGYPPFEYVDDHGQIVGFDVDLANLIADKLGKKLSIQDMEFEGVILSLKQGKIDLIISGMEITPARLNEINMIPYHGENKSHFSLIFWENIPGNIKSLEDIAQQPNAFVAVESGSIPEAYMAKYPAIKIKSFQGSLAPLIDVKYGKSLANLVAPEVATYLKGKHPEIKILEIPIANEEALQGFGIGIKKENHDLKEKVQTIIKELKETGELNSLKAKWLKGVDNVSG